MKNRRWRKQAFGHIRHTSDNDADAEMAQQVVNETSDIPAAEDSMSDDDLSSATDNGITQAQVYDNLKRIGELEDQKKSIQEEIQNRTEQLREVIGHIDRGTILYKMLESVLKDINPKDGAASRRKAAKGAPTKSPTGPKKKSRR
jgi:hypothetical protein